MRIRVPAPVEKAVQLLEQAGHTACPVGGCVRDSLLGLEPHDWDICTSSAPEETRDVFSAYRTIDTGIRHGTVCVLLDGMPLEITTYRTDGEYRDHRHPEHVTFSSRLEDDLSRRDFTVNAMALNVRSGEVIDLFGGREDLERKLIRCVGEPEKRFDEDALRILRAARFASRLSFELDEGTFLAMNRMKRGLDSVSRERVREELNGLLLSPAPSGILRKCREVIFQVLPELEAECGCRQNSIYHDRDVFEHTLAAVDAAPRDLTVRWAALLHDIGKPSCRVSDSDGRDHFGGHPEAGVRLAGKMLERLRFPKAFQSRLLLLIREHDNEINEGSVWPLMSRMGSEAFDQLLLLKRADLSAHAEWIRPRAEELNVFSEEKKRLIERGAALSISDLKVNGHDLEALGFHGAEIGKMLSALLYDVVNRRVPNEKDALLEVAGELREGQ